MRWPRWANQENSNPGKLPYSLQWQGGTPRLIGMWQPKTTARERCDGALSSLIPHTR